MRLLFTAISKRYVALLLSGLVVGAGTAGASAAVYHVSPKGSDSGPGNTTAPWRSLQRAADAMVPGDETIVDDGVYAGFHSTRSGTSSQPITFRAGSDHAMITGRNSDTPDCINIETHDWIVVEGFRIDGAPRVGIRVAEASDVVLRGNVITNCQLDAILTGFAVRVRVIDNVCANSKREHGIYVSNSHGPGDNPLISGNRCYGNGRSGIQFNGDCSSGGDGTIDDGIIENNLIYQNKTKGISLISARNVIVRNNIIFDNLGGAAGIHLTDEPDCERPSIGVVVNNTIVETRIAAIRITDASVNNRIFNNVIVGPDRGKLIADEVGASKIDNGSNVLRTSPRGLFVNSDKWNFHLADRSPARGAGKTFFDGVAAPQTDRDGKKRAGAGPIDAGAYEDNGGESGRAEFGQTIMLASAGGGGGGGGEAAASNDGTEEARAAAIIPGHPRLWLTGDRLTMLRRKACLDAQGNPLPGCQTNSDWNRLRGLLPGGYWGEEPWHHALAYIVTGDVTHANRAISDMDARVQTIDNTEDRGQGNFLRIANTMRGVGLVYDWCHDLLSETQKQNYRAYMNQLLQELWNPFNNPTHEWNAWGVDDPGNNFYYSFLTGTCYAGLAMYGENTNPPSLPFRGTTYNDILEFLYARIEQQSIGEHLNTWGKGGSWHEGNNYGLLSKRYILEMFTMLRDAGGPDYFQQTDFAREAVLYHLYSMVPDFSMGYPGGDLAGGTDPYDTAFMLLATNALRGTVEAEYAQYFANHIVTEEPWSWWEFIQPYGVLFRDPDIPERDWRQDLPTQYYAEGGGWMNSRSGWGANDVSVSFVCTDRIQGHQAQDQGAFLIFKNGMQATHGNLHSSYGTYQMADAFNTLLINGTGQAYGVDWDDIPTVVRDIGFVRKFEGGPEFSYIVGDASDAYYTGAGQFGNGNTRLLDIFTRELVHVFPGYVIVYDRVTPRNATHLPTYQLQTTNMPTQNGNRIEASDGAGRLYNWTLLPENHTIQIRQHPGGDAAGDATSISSYQTWIDPVTAQTNHLLLNVLYTTDATDNSTPVVSKVTSQSDNMVGVKIEEAGGENFVIMFSTDPDVDMPVSSVIYDVGYNIDSRQFLFGLVPDTRYNVDVARTETGYRVSIAAGTEFRSSRQGVLRFDLEGQVDGQDIVAER